MRYTLKEKPPKPPHGFVRLKTWFAYLPVRIGKECRWLEQVTVSQRYHNKLHSSPMDDLNAGFPLNSKWINVEFVD